jgi:superfamily II DNA or RNA helicase
LLAQGAQVRLTVGAEIEIARPTPAATADLIAGNTIPNPDFARRERFGLWTGGTDRTITTWRRSDAKLVVPRGSFALVVNICRRHGLDYVVDDKTVCPPLGIEVRQAGALYPYQARALDDVLQRRAGFLDAPTGSGKTNILLSAIPRLKTTTLILTHTKGLLDQTAQRCRDWLDVELGRIGAGKWEVRPVTIAMVQTLARRGCDDISAYFGAVLIDEAHHVPCVTMTGVVNSLSARYKYGFTATAWRKDALQELMWRTIGPVTARVQQADVVAAGKILKPDIETVETSFFYDIQDSIDWTRMLTALVTDDSRNDLIASEVRARLTPDTRALILTDRIDHVHRLAELLADCAPGVLTGELPKSAREAAMGRVRGGAPLTIATASLLGEGIDVPGWDLLFLASPMAGGPRTLQAVGRVSRAAPGKASALVVDFVDSCVPALVAARRQRERVLGIGRAA